jgi:hypothetical protein
MGGLWDINSLISRSGSPWWYCKSEIYVSEQEIYSLYLGLKKSIIEKNCTIKTTTMSSLKVTAIKHRV